MNERTVSMEGVAGGPDSTGEENRGVVARWIARHARGLHRPVDGAADSLRHAPDPSAYPLGTGNGLPNAEKPSSSAPSTETVKSEGSRAVGLPIIAAVAVASFLSGAALTANGPVQHRAIEATGAVPAQGMQQLELCQRRLEEVRVTVSEMSQAAGLAAVQLSQCFGDGER